MKRAITSALAALVLLLFPTASFALDGNSIHTYSGGYGHSVYQTPDGGALLGGTFGAVSICCQPWLIKLAADGSVQWQFTYESAGLSGANNIVPTRDGGYVMSGEGTRFMVVKLDANGGVEWAKDYGDGGYTFLRVLESNEGDFLVTGATFLGGGGASNGRAILLDPDGNVRWEKVYGLPVFVDFFSSATVAYNGNFIASGSSRGDYWVMELDRRSGAIVWQKTYGGPFEDTGLVVTKVLKNRYLVVGASDTYSQGGLRDWWAVIITSSGEVKKQFSLGGFDAEDPHTAIGTSDGGFMIGGGTGSFGAGLSDIWLVKFDADARVQWQKAYGQAARTDSAWQILETASGYSVIGDSYYFPDTYEVWLMDIDRNGGLAPSQCGVVTDTDAIPLKTGTKVRTGTAQTLDIPTGLLDMDVLATPQPVPIEACIP